MNDSLASRVYEKKHIDKLKIKIKLLGINYDPTILIALHLLISIVLFIGLLFLKNGYIIAPIITIIFYFSSEYFFLDYRIQKRSLNLQKDALEYIPIFLLSLENGRNIKKSLTNSTEIVNNNLSKEFGKVLNDIEAGHSLNEALEELEQRIPSNNINNIILNIKEANKLGNSISESVNLQLDLIKENLKTKEIKRLKKVPLLLSITFIIFLIVMLGVLIMFK